MDKQNCYDVIIIGGGIIGSQVFSRLVLNGAKVLLVEAGEDVTSGATKANSAIVHAGYDCVPGTNKARFNVRGNELFPEIAKRLGEKIVECGSLVVCDESGLDGLNELLRRGKLNGVPGLKILNAKELHALEPNLSESEVYGLYAPSAKIVSPYNFAISLCEEAIINGGELKLNFPVDNLKFCDGLWTVSSGNKSVTAKFVINCAGAGATLVNKLAGAEKFSQNLTLGEYILLDKSETGLVGRPIFPLPTKAGKGILVLPTIAGNILCGPTAKDIKSYTTEVTPEGISEIKTKTSMMVNNLNFKKSIKLYAGVRVKVGDDFQVGFSKIVPNFYYTIGISSPGLASSPAIAEQIAIDLEKAGLKLRPIKAKLRRPYTNTRELDEKALNKLIAKNEKYGKLVCRCEGITEGEIEEVLNGPIKPLTAEGVKRRLRTTMGRCQGSFCLSQVIDVMSKTYNIKSEEVIVRGNTPLVLSGIKEGGIYEN